MATRLGVPRMIFVNKLDRERASFERTLDQLQDRFGAGVAPLELPIGAEADFRGIADLLTDTAHIYEGGVPHRTDPRRHGGRWSTRSTTTSSRASSWPTTPCSSATSRATCRGLDELEHALAMGIETGQRVPGRLRLGHAEVGIDRLADLLVEIGPPPADRPGTVGPATPRSRWRRPDGEPLAFVFKTIADPFVGQVSLLKVLSGTIRNDDHLVNSRTGTDERLHGLFVVRGKDHEPVDRWPPATSAAWPS